MDRKFSLTLLTLALAGSLCACSNTTTEATATPDNSAWTAPENRSGIVGYGYNGYGYDGYDNAGGSTWGIDNGGMWDAGETAERAADNVGKAARDAASDMRRGINDVTRDVERNTSTIW